MTSNIILDKALEAIDEKSYEQEWYSNWIMNTKDVKEIITKLVDTQTVEMTQEAYNELNNLRSHNGDLDGVLSRARFPYNPLKQYTTEELAQAWLHPEIIKVVD